MACDVLGTSFSMPTVSDLDARRCRVVRSALPSLVTVQVAPCPRSGGWRRNADTALRTSRARHTARALDHRGRIVIGRGWARD